MHVIFLQIHLRRGPSFIVSSEEPFVEFAQNLIVKNLRAGVKPAHNGHPSMRWPHVIVILAFGSKNLRYCHWHGSCSLLMLGGSELHDSEKVNSSG